MKHEVDEGMPVLRVRTFDAEAADEDSAAADDDAAMIPSPDTVSAILGFDDAFEGEKHFGFAVEKEDWGGWFHNVRVSAKATGSDFSCAQLVRMTYRKFRKAGTSLIRSTTCGIPFLPGAVWEFQAEACRVHGESTPIWGEMRFTPLPRSPFRETKLECLLPYVVGHMIARAGTLPAAGLMEVVAAAVSLQKVDIEDFIEVRSGETYESLKSEFLAMHPDADLAGFFVTVDQRLLTDWTQSRSVSSAGEFIGTIAALEKVECFGEMLLRITIPLSEAELESDDSEDWIPMVVYVNPRVVEGGLQELHVGDKVSGKAVLVGRIFNPDDPPEFLDRITIAKKRKEPEDAG